MKALSASSISQYERSVDALTDYNRSIQLGLAAWLRSGHLGTAIEDAPAGHRVEDYGVIVFGSDQGLVGQFNEVIADFAMSSMASLRGKGALFAVGERVAGRLTDAGVAVSQLFTVPSSVLAITSVVANIQVASEASRVKGGYSSVYLFYNRPREGGSFEPVGLRLLPLDRSWLQRVTELPWPSAALSEVVGGETATLRGLIREYLFISIFRACAESLASENSSRLMAMERANKNIDELLSNTRGAFHRLRQSSIDEELFDVVSGYESLTSESARPA